jgi:uncharacterized protein (DUF2384 family)
MGVELKVEDVRERALDYGLYARSGVSPLNEFFQFWRYPRVFSDPAALADCYFYDLYVNYKVAWGAPHPAIFEQFFPAILARLVGKSNSLTLFVKSIDPEYFNELRVIETLLAPRNLLYVLLPDPILPGDRRTQVDVGHLIFEWPADSLDYVVENWFMSPQVSVEGYISAEPPLARLAELYFAPDSEERVREVLRAVEVGFRVWPDNNGLFLATDKLDRRGLEERLYLSDLNPSLQEAANRFDAGA